MAVLPGSSGDVPESGNDPSLGGVKWMEDVTEQGVKNRAYDQVFPSMQAAKDSLLGNLLGGFFGVMTGIFTGVLSVIPSWFPSGARQFAEQVRDGQEALAGRADLLEGVRGYCAAYQSLNINGEWSTNNYRTLPYDAPLGPYKGAHVDETKKGIVFDEEGLWTVWVYAHARSTVFTGNNLCALHINIYRPGGSSVRYITFDEFTGGEYATVGGSFPVVIPEPGCWIKVEAYSGRWRWWDGGARYSFQAALKNDNRLDNPGQDTVPDETGP